MSNVFEKDSSVIGIGRLLSPHPVNVLPACLSVPVGNKKVQRQHRQQCKIGRPLSLMRSRPSAVLSLACP
jgi:hypothetical protein